LIEAITFVIVAYFSIDRATLANNSSVLYPLMRNLLPNIGNLIIAIATTWYVVFTYSLVKVTEEIRKESSEPRVSIQWKQSEKKGEYCFKEYNAISDQSIQNFGEASGGELEEEKTQRYVNLEIDNSGKGPLGFLEITIAVGLTGKGSISMTGNVQELSFPKRKMELSSQQKKEITVLDLKGIPDLFEVNLKINYLSYTSAVSGNLLKNSDGETEFTCTGIALIKAVPKTAAEPILG
jgi:hypothetical protein